jgi:cephalosporin hydroxylase
MNHKEWKMSGFSGKKWIQSEKEIKPFIKLLKHEGCTSYLEIGSFYGDNWHAVGMALPEGSKLVAVDLPGFNAGMKTDRNPDTAIYLERAAEDLRKHNRNAHVIIGNSQDPKIVSQVAALAPFDAVFIDGDHTEHGVRSDLMNYGPMAKIIAFHDIYTKKKQEWKCQVMPTFKEFAKGRRSCEFAYDKLRNGIGVVWR